MSNPIQKRPFRLGVILLFGFCAFSVLAGRLLYLHVWIGDELAQKAQQSRERITVLEAPRGDIIDLHGNLLATTVFTRTLGVDPSVVRPEDLEKLPALSQLIHVPVEELEKKFAPGEIRRVEGSDVKFVKIQWRKLAEGIKEDLYEDILALGIRGVRGDKSYDRQYPGKHLASHLIGFLNHEDTPVMGVERMMDFYLRGQRGWRQSERDAKRRELPQFRQREVDSIGGLVVQMTLDSYVQHVAEEELRRVVDEYQPLGGTVIVSEPATGNILALANYPDFDLNEFNKFPIDSHRNRAVTDIYEPGSTFKIVPVAAAIEEELVTLSDLFDCSISTIEVGSRMMSLPKDHHEYGKLGIKDILVKSSNRGVAQLGMLMGEKTLFDYTKRFGFGDKSGWPLEGEVSGILSPVKRWNGLTITRLPMGHAVGVTPIQTHYAMSAIANGGVLMEPNVIASVRNEKGETVMDFGPQARQRVISGTTAEMLAWFLEEVVGEHGTAQSAAIPDYEVAGKTGTTQKVVDGKYSRNHHVASFSGFFPASNPEVVITVVIDEPQLKGVGYGGKVAAPVFKNIAEKLIPHMGINPPSRFQNNLAWQDSNK